MKISSSNVLKLFLILPQIWAKSQPRVLIKLFLYKKRVYPPLCCSCRSFFQSLFCNLVLTRVYLHNICRFSNCARVPWWRRGWPFVDRDVFIRSLDQGGVILTPETKSDFSGTELPQKGGNQSNILVRAILNLFKQNKYLKTFLGCGFVGVYWRWYIWKSTESRIFTKSCFKRLFSIQV